MGCHKNVPIRGSLHAMIYMINQSLLSLESSTQILTTIKIQLAKEMEVMKIWIIVIIQIMIIDIEEAYEECMTQIM